MKGTMVPVLIANYAPFRLVLRETDKWNPQLQELNAHSYDYVKLARISTFLDVDIQPYSLAVTFDGSLVLPTTNNFHSKEEALKKFNETLCYLLLGGLYCEAVHPMDIIHGGLFIDGYLHRFSSGIGSLSNMHSAFQFKKSGIESIKLLNPLTISVKELEIAYERGKIRFKKLNGISPILLLNGISNYVIHRWPEALVFLWTSIEQIINKIWEVYLIKADKQDSQISGRKQFLQDFRTWTIAAKAEVLFQKQLINGLDYELINTARRIRNSFMHSGIELNEQHVFRTMKCLFGLLSLLITDFKDREELRDIEEMILRNQRLGLFNEKSSYDETEVTHWMSLPPLPGDSHWEGKYEIITELVLQPLGGK